MAIAARLPPLKELTDKINRLLQVLHKCNDERGGLILPQLCRFTAGDQRIAYEPYPKSVSYETVRAALQFSGMRNPRWRRA